jgi:hypothetical protein
VESVAAQGAAGHRQLLRAQAGQQLLHADLAAQHTPLCMALAVQRDQRVKQRHHAAALGPHGFARGDVRGQAVPQRGVGRNGGRVQFGVAAGNPQCVAGGYRRIGQRREKHQLGAECAQGVEVGGVNKAEGGIARNGNRLALQRREAWWQRVLRR